MWCCSVQAAKCAYSVLIIAVYWMTECLPMAVTAILPVVLMTWLGVMDSKELCRSYLKVISLVLLGHPSALVLRSRGGFTFYCWCIFFFFSMWYLQAPSADRHETLPHDPPPCCGRVKVVSMYEGRSINKLQNGAIPLILKIWKIRNILSVYSRGMREKNE